MAGDNVTHLALKPRCVCVCVCNVRPSAADLEAKGGAVLLNEAQANQFPWRAASALLVPLIGQSLMAGRSARPPMPAN